MSLQHERKPAYHPGTVLLEHGRQEVVLVLFMINDDACSFERWKAVRTALGIHEHLTVTADTPRTGLAPDLLGLTWVRIAGVARGLVARQLLKTSNYHN